MTGRGGDVDMAQIRRVVGTLPPGIVRDTILAERASLPRAEFIAKAEVWIKMVGAEQRSAKLAVQESAEERREG